MFVLIKKVEKATKLKDMFMKMLKFAYAIVMKLLMF